MPLLNGAVQEDNVQHGHLSQQTSASGMTVSCKCCLFISISIHNILTIMYTAKKGPADKIPVNIIYTNVYSPFTVCLFFLCGLAGKSPFSCKIVVPWASVHLIRLPSHQYLFLMQYIVQFFSCGFQYFFEKDNFVLGLIFCLMSCSASLGLHL